MTKQEKTPFEIAVDKCICSLGWGRNQVVARLEAIDKGELEKRLVEIGSGNFDCLTVEQPKPKAKAKPAK